jgi:hypothetical protein
LQINNFWLDTGHSAAGGHIILLLLAGRPASGGSRNGMGPSSGRSVDNVVFVSPVLIILNLQQQQQMI